MFETFNPNLAFLLHILANRQNIYSYSGFVTCGVTFYGRSQWPRGLRRRSAANHLLRSWVWIPPGAWMFVCYECCVLSGRVLCDELITHPEESYRLCCVVVCDLETSRMRRPWPALGRSATEKKSDILWGISPPELYNYIIVPSSIRAISHVDGTVMFLDLTGANHSKAAEYHDLGVP